MSPPDGFLEHGDWPREPETEAERLARWKRDQRRHGALPTVELFPDLAARETRVLELGPLFADLNDGGEDGNEGQE